MAGAAHTLFDWAVDAFITPFGRHCEEFLRFLNCLSRDASLGFLVFLSLLFLPSGAAFGIAWALLAALVLTLETDLVGAILGAAVMAGAVYAHADGSFDTLRVDGGRGHRDPFVRL